MTPPVADLVWIIEEKLDSILGFLSKYVLHIHFVKKNAGGIG